MENLSQLGQRDEMEKGEIQSMRGTQTTFSGFEDGGKEALCPGIWWPLEAGNNPQMTASKKMGILVLLLKETEQQNEFSFRAPREEHSLADNTLILLQGDLCQTSKHPNCKINLCCLICLKKKKKLCIFHLVQ